MKILLRMGKYKKKILFLQQNQNKKATQPGNMAKPDIITGQFVCIEQTPASVGERIVARLIDYTALTVYCISVGLLIGRMSGAMNELTTLSIVFMVYLPATFYSVICEMLFGGRSLGKYVMGTRVVMADGSMPGVGASLLRWMLIPIDIYFSCLGLLFILCGKKRQRLGDLAAGTMVIRQPDMGKMHLSLREFNYARHSYRPIYPEAQNLSFGQAEVIKKTLDNVYRQGYKHADLLTEKISKTLGITPKESNNVEFLRTLLHDYQFYALELV